MTVNEKIFREYDIRGIADRDLPDALVKDLGRALGTFIHKRGGTRITLGRDCRVSSERIKKALLEGLLASGIDVIDIGLVPTPLLYFSVFELNTDGGIMITGSHNPPEHNGFKVCVGKTTIHGAEIQQVKNVLLGKSFVSGSGSLTEVDIKPSYTKMILDNIKHPLNLKICVDSGNGMGGIIGPEIFRKLGCEVIELFSELDGTFPNHHPDPTVVENLAALKNKIRESRAVVGIGFDGDADRIGVVDPSGRIIYGDELLVVYS